MAPLSTALSALAAIAAKQHGLMTHEQATAAGLNRMTLSRLVRSGAWQIVRPRVFRRAAATQSEEQALRAVCLWLGDRRSPRARAAEKRETEFRGIAVSHLSAGRLLGLDLARGEVEVTTPPKVGSTLPGVVFHRTRTLEEQDVKFIRGIAVTTGARTIIDLASCLDEERLAIVVEEAWRRKIAAPDWVARRLDKLASQGRKTGALAEILADCRRREGPMESALEVKLWWRMKRSELPLPIPGYEFRDDFGQPMHLDFAFPERQLAIECDGFEHHGDREAFERDRQRAARLVAMGWRVMPVTWRQLENEKDKVIERIRQALGYRSEPIG